MNPHTVVVGAGFGGLECAAALGASGLPVTLIDRHNYHLFVPLLYQVATAALSPADIAQPIRRILRRHRSVTVRMGEVSGVDAARRRVRLSDGAEVAYDRLVIAAGSVCSFFGHDEWARHAPCPRSVNDAGEIRSRLLLAFERAELAADPAEVEALMTTVVVGGGPIRGPPVCCWWRPGRACWRGSPRGCRSMLRIGCGSCGSRW